MFTVKLIEKLQKAIMIVKMCRPLVLAASKHHKSCGGLCLHCVDLSVPPLVLTGIFKPLALLTYIWNIYSYVCQHCVYIYIYFYISFTFG